MGRRKEEREPRAHARARGKRGASKHESGIQLRPQGYYGSGGSYGYGGGFEHPDYPEPEQAKDDEARHARRGGDPGWFHGVGPMEPFDAYGSFGSTLGDYQHAPQHAFRARSTRGPFFGRAPLGYTRSDERIRDDVCDQLMLGHVDPSAVSVSVSAGEVTLEGSVETRRAKYMVEEVAASVLGVREVNNRLRVGQGGR
ncbi:MAG: BON domain-containing protein [Myxococcales bacterium]